MTNLEIVYEGFVTYESLEPFNFYDLCGLRKCISFELEPFSKLRIEDYSPEVISICAQFHKVMLEQANLSSWV